MSDQFVSTGMTTTVARVQCVESATQLGRLRDEWNQLAGDVPLRRFEWLATWWHHYRSASARLFVIAARGADDRLVGLAPFYLRRSRRAGRVLHFLGSGEICSDYLSLLTAPGHAAEIGQQLADWMATDARNVWDRLELTGASADDPALEAFAARLQSHGYDAYTRPGVNGWRVTFPDSWEDYLMTLSKSRRERTRQLKRRAFDTGRVVNGVVQRQEELKFYFERLVELHQKRRNSKGEPGSFASPRFAAFHLDTMRQMLDAGLLRLWWTNIDGRPAAIEYDLLGGDTVYFYQSGIEPSLVHDRPGWLGTIGSLRDAMARGYRHFDFMRGDEGYKASWGAVPRPMLELRVVAPRAAARIRHATWSAGQWARSVAKHGLQAAKRWSHGGDVA